VRYFPPPEDDRDLYAVFLLEEFYYVVDFKIYVVSFYFRTDFYLFNEAACLPLSGVALAFTLFVKVFAEIHYPANGRFCLRRDLDQVEPFLFGLGQRFLGGDYANLFPLVVN